MLLIVMATFFLVEVNVFHASLYYTGLLYLPTINVLAITCMAFLVSLSDHMTLKSRGISAKTWVDKTDRMSVKFKDSLSKATA